MPRPTIAVIIPAHPARLTNGKLTRALKSVQEQTLLPDEIHIAIDNDGEGAAPTRHRALMAARTDLVAFLDSDDVFMVKHLALMLRHLQEREADFVYSWFKVLQEFADGTTRVLEHDPIFPPEHYLNDWDPENPIETTVTTMVRTELAQSVGFKPLDRGEQNSGEDFGFTLGCQAAGGKISHLKRKTWYWSHARLPDNSGPANTSGLPTKGDAAWSPR